MGSKSSSSKGDSSDNKDHSSHSNKSYNNSGNSSSSTSKEDSSSNTDHPSNSNESNKNSGDSNKNSKDETMKNEDHNSMSSLEVIRSATSVAVDFMPFFGNIKAVHDSIRGEDLITGEKLTGRERLLSAVGAVIPGGSGLKNVGKAAIKITKNSSKCEKIVKNATKIEKEVKEIKNVEKNLNKAKTFTREENVKYYTKKGYAENELGGSGKPKYHNVKCKNSREAEEKAGHASSHNQKPILHRAHYDKETGKKKIGPHYHPSDNKGNEKPIHYVWEDN